MDHLFDNVIGVLNDIGVRDKDYEPSHDSNLPDSYGEYISIKVKEATSNEVREAIADMDEIMMDLLTVNFKNNLSVNPVIASALTKYMQDTFSRYGYDILMER